MNRIRGVAGMVAMGMLASACASPPMGPRVAWYPGPNKSFDAFQQDQYVCKGYAQQETGGQAQDANNRAVGSAVIGTLLGAGLGAAVGGGRGAAIGAAGGAVAGTAVGASGSQRSQYGIQQQYDNAYSQCMYSKGNQQGGGYGPAPYGPPQQYGPPQGYNPPPPGY